MILSFYNTIEKYNEYLNEWTSKFMSNPAMAGVVALLMFVFICIGVSYFTKK